MKLDRKHRIFISLVNILSKTWRINVEGDYPKSRGLVAFWHGQMLPVWKFFSKYSPVAVVSQSKDGEILSTLLSKWNFTLERGSSSKDGKEVLNQISQKAKDRIVLITPDGPTGPINQFKAGAVVAAKKSRSPLYLCKVKIKNKLVFKKSWDKFEFPLPFSQIKIEFLIKLEIVENLNRNRVDEKIKQCEKMMNN